jgi:hypothetical protein
MTEIDKNAVESDDDDGLRSGFRVVDDEPQRRPAVEQRLREELPHHVTGQLARRAAQGLRGLLDLRGTVGLGATDAKVA